VLVKLNITYCVCYEDVQFETQNWGTILMYLQRPDIGSSWFGWCNRKSKMLSVGIK
jgi:hypothetical protein